MDAEWGTPGQPAIRRARPEALAEGTFAGGSGAPEVAASCWFVQQADGLAVIGSITATAPVPGEAGTVSRCDAAGLELVLTGRRGLP